KNVGPIPHAAVSCRVKGSHPRDRTNEAAGEQHPRSNPTSAISLDDKAAAGGKYATGSKAAERQCSGVEADGTQRAIKSCAAQPNKTGQRRAVKFERPPCTHCDSATAVLKHEIAAVRPCHRRQSKRQQCDPNNSFHTPTLLGITW